MKRMTCEKIVFLAGCLMAMLTLSGCPSESSTSGDVPGGEGLNGQQWHLKNVGQKAYASGESTAGEDINQAETYAGGNYGSGIIVAVVDSGLEIEHPDLIANVVEGESWDFVNMDDDPTSSATDGDHGTSVGGIIAAADNAIGGRGVAPKAFLKGFNWLQDQTEAGIIDSLGGSTSNPKSDDVSIFNMSFGSDANEDFLIDPDIKNHLEWAVDNLRDGNGAIFVKSTGNGFKSYGDAACARSNAIGLSCQNVSNDRHSTTPYSINVGALNAEGKRSSYSTSGSGVWISAPGGEYGYNEDVYPDLEATAYGPAILTTDQSGCDQGYANTVDDPANSFQNNANGANPNCDYTSTFNGTSSAAPVTSGSIALILKANPDLSWRDVKHILASTARKVDPTAAAVSVTLSDGAYEADRGWFTNAAGYDFHNWYGFGAVDVDAAVEMAQSYASNLGTWDTATATSGAISINIPDNDKDGITSQLAIADDLTIESVTIAVWITHPYCGDLGIELLSPEGTKSILFTIRNGFNSSNLSGMVLLSNAYYEESSAGNWTIRVVDGDASDTGTLTRWDLTIYGH